MREFSWPGSRSGTDCGRRPGEWDSRRRLRTGRPGPAGVNGYVLALAGGLLLFGRCADLFGRRRLLLIGLALLTAATLLAGLSPTGSLLQYGAWLALGGQAPTDVAPGQYGIASGVLKTSTHIGAAVAVAVFATTIDAVGSDTPGDGSAYAMAYLAAAALTVSGAAATGLLIHGSRSRPRPGLDRGPAQ